MVMGTPRGWVKASLAQARVITREMRSKKETRMRARDPTRAGRGQIQRIIDIFFLTGHGLAG